MEVILNRMSSRHRLMVFLVAAVIFLAKNITAFLIVNSLVERCMLIASNDTIVTLSLFTSISSGLYFRLNA